LSIFIISLALLVCYNESTLITDKLSLIDIHMVIFMSHWFSWTDNHGQVRFHVAYSIAGNMQ